MLIKYVCFIIIVQTLCVSYAKKRSLTFVIDDTLSMQDDINQVQRAANKIMDVVTRKKGSEIENVVLVTFNDEEVVIRERTSKRKKLVDALDNIVVHNPYNYDCPESALSGIVTALDLSGPESYLYVFTDASAKDHDKLNEVKRLCEMKQSQVVFVLTGDCKGYVGEDLGSLSVYYEIARASNGLVFHISKNEVIDIVDTIPDIITEQRSVITSKVIRASEMFKPVEFTVDDKTEYVSIQAAGENVDLLVTDKKRRRMPFQETLWKSNVKMAKFHAPRTGSYYAWVKGYTDITIVVYARTDFTFDHGFSEFVPKSLADASKQPIADRAHHLSISVTDSEHTVDIKSAEILDMNERLIKTLPLRKTSGNFYITDMFISPSNMFKIQVSGTVKKTGKDIKRISKTAIEPQVPPRPAPKAPVVLITEGSRVDVDYAGHIKLTCKVSGYPTPRIWWTSTDGTIVSTKSNAVELPYDYISYLNLSNVRYPGLYYCKAQNEEALNFKPVTVNPKSPFRVLAPLSDTTPAKYGERKQINCDISSSHPMDIQWNTPIKPLEYTLSADKKVLTIKSVDLLAQGRFECKATLKSDSRQMRVVSTNVIINDLAPPAIRPTTDTITVPHGVEVHLMCKISGGVPHPRVSWKLMRNHEHVYKEMASGEELTVPSASLADAGTYICIAQNLIGEAKQTTNLIVQVPPTVIIEEGSKKSVAYESSHVITCKIVAYPLPRIEWKNSNGNILPSEEIKTKNEITSRLNLLKIQASDTYTCFAENILGKTARSIDVEMMSPFVVLSHPGDVTSSKFGTKTDITCDVRSDYPLRIRWFFKNSSEVSEVQTSDKYILSANGTTLRILYTDLASVGAYSCEASLVENEKQKISFSTNVQIDDLTAPVLQNTHPKVLTVKTNDKVKIPCTIVAGNPPPVVSWQVMKKGEENFKELSASGQELVIDSVALADAGMYRCDAKNVKGQSHKTTDLIVQVPPAMVIEEGSKKSVAYESSHVMTCKVVAYPLPRIEWKNSNGNILPSHEIKTKNEITSRLNLLKIQASDTYTCFAENILGKTASSIDVEMMSPFVVLTHPGGVTSSKFGSKTDITCDVRSDHPLRIRWFFKNSSEVSEVQTSNKYKLSATGTTLRILYTDLASVGTYSCEASLVENEKQKIYFTTNVLIDDLTAPVLQNTHLVLTVNSNDKVKIPCTIVAGNPPPVVSWQVMKKGEENFKELSASGQELVIESVALSDAGMYRCDARNVKGQSHKTTELIVQVPPAMVIEEGSKKSVAYKSSHVITCKVVAYPLPRIEWKNSNGNILPSQEIKTKNEITSRLNLLKIQASDTYTCFAENILGKTASSIVVEMMSPFVVLTHPGGVTSSNFGSKTDINCDVRSDHPLRIRWFFKNSSGVSEVQTSDKYKLSANGTTLRILYTDLASAGAYSCEASLVENQKQKISFTTNVQIDDLTAPVLQNTHPKVLTVKTNDKVKIPCTIVAGNPPPVVSWQVMKKGEENFKELSASGQELVIDSVALADAGMYRCDAKNVKGQSHKTTDLIVQVPPAMVIEEGSKKSVAYESSHVMTCKVVAYPLPRIEWKNSNGNILPSHEIKTKNEITSRLNLLKIQASDTYTCFAENILGKTASSIVVEMMSPFVVLTHPGGVTSSKFGSKTDITCDVRSDHPLRIRWFFKNSPGVSEVQTSDKYKLSATGTTLRILYTDLASAGAYSCEASLVENQKQKISFTTNVQIDDLTAPVLQNTHPKVLTVKTNDKVKIPCTIVAGNPPPVVSWQVMKKGQEIFKELSALGPELVIDNVALSDAGMYRCVAKNVKGQAHKITELVVQQAPEAYIAEGTAVIVPYKGTNEFTCSVVAFPLPKIVWRDSKGNELHAMDNVENLVEVVSRLNITNIKSSDTYTCHAKNYLGETTVAVKVSPLSAIDFPIHPPETTSVRNEEPTTLFCDAKSSFPIKINWYYQKDRLAPKSKILTSDKYTISADERTLLIMSVSLGLVGKYTCEASLVDDKNERKSYTTNLEINDLKAPAITYSNETITVKKGELMSAFCIANGTPKPVLTWQFKSKVSDVFTALPNEGERISIPKIGYKEAGLYKCTAINAIGTQSQNIHVVVHGEPRIRNNDSVYFGVTGDKVLKIPCEVDGVPEPTITWTNGDKVVTSDAKLSVNKNTLYIKNPTEKDSDNFTCKAQNTYGYDTMTFTADISDFITYDEELNTNIYLKLGESKEIKCHLPHSDPQSIRWYVNGEKTKVLGTFFSIKNAQYSNDGNYTCRLNTEEGSESLNYVVDVGYKPSFMTTPPATIDWKGDKEDILDCYVRAKPRVKVQWFYNGKPLDVTLPGVAIFGWGQYTCKVSNVHDSVERTFNVTSSGCLINRTTVNAQNTPLFVDEELTTWPLLATTNEFYTLSENEMITLECATGNQPRNTFKALPNAKKINAKCYKEDKFIVDGKMYKINELQCKEYVRSSQLFTKKSCMMKGEVIEVGFKLIEGFLSVYEVCYSGLDSRTLYTKVVMSAANRGNIVTPSFKHPGTKGGHGAEPRKCAYSRRWLVKPEDVAFGPAQAAMLSDEHNAVPVYEPCEGTSRWSWSGVEKTVESALYSSDTVTVWTGASQYDSSGIPRYLWKVVMFDDDTFETIVYVNAASPSSSDVLCPETIPDRFTDVTDANDKYTYTCSMEDFMIAFKIPSTDFTSTS